MRQPETQTMRFTVMWLPDARDELATIWLESADRNEITKTSAEIERRLRQEADSIGVDFYGDRLLVVLPMAVVYNVSTPDRLVQVLSLWHT